eukprot:714364-Amphidinium_carterae.2
MLAVHLRSGIMLESNDKALGHDFWEPGVYCTPNMKAGAASSPCNTRLAARKDATRLIEILDLGPFVHCC